MPQNHRTKRNQRTREMISDFIAAIEYGSIFTSGKLSRAISTPRRSVTSTTIGRLLHERDDVKLVRCGIWKKVC